MPKVLCPCTAVQWGQGTSSYLLATKRNTPGQCHVQVDASYFTLNFANGFSTPTANDIAIYLNNQMVFEFVCDEIPHFIDNGLITKSEKKGQAHLCFSFFLH
mmetsp:Transcript_9010/g.11432  ORF Transcript_9010/g.11432 Transcript_9010/m.11432 type:complete len:102 (+) Transcript_9010:224-529(+)